jgi:putative polyketide hydroxylase
VDEPELETEVLVVGGGPVGLTCAALVAGMGVRTLLIERRTSVSYYPKARALTARTLEVFRQLGVERAVHEAMPAERTRNYAMGPGLGSSALTLTPFGLGSLDPRPDTPCTGSFCPQDHLEPILEARLRREPSAAVRFGHELISLAQDGEGVIAEVRNLADGARRRARARLLVGADGARGLVASQIGVTMSQPVELDPALTVIFKAPLAQRVDPLASVYLLLYDPKSGSGGMVSGVSLARDPEEWSMVSVQTPEWGDELTPQTAPRWRELVRQVIGVPDLPVEVTAVARWWRTATVAERLAQGRVALAGDSAHLMPPAGGLGLNTGVQDAHNLAWRLAAIVGGAAPDLLDDYDRERRPEIARSVEAAVANYHKGGDMDAIWNKPQLGLSLGVQYEAGSFASDEPPPARTYPYHDYAPSGRPGGRALHLWLDEAAGRSILDLFGRDFVLLVERESDPAGLSAARLKAAGAPVAVAPLAQQMTAERLARWRELYGVGEGGAVLVRPDGIVAWRTRDPEASGLEEAFWRIVRNPGRRWRRATWAGEGG